MSLLKQAKLQQIGKTQESSGDHMALFSDGEPVTGQQNSASTDEQGPKEQLVASELFKRVNRTGNDVVSRDELLQALRDDTGLQHRLNLPTRPGDTQREAFECAFQSMRPSVNVDELTAFLVEHNITRTSTTSPSDDAKDLATTALHSVRVNGQTRASTPPRLARSDMRRSSQAARPASGITRTPPTIRTPVSVQTSQSTTPLRLARDDLQPSSQVQPNAMAATPASGVNRTPPAVRTPVSVQAGQTTILLRSSSTPIQPVRAELARLGLGDLREQAMLEGATQTQINEALDSDNAKQQFIEMIYQAQSDKVAAAEQTAEEEKSQLREQIRLGALAMHQQEHQQAVQRLQAELTGLKLAALQERALLSGTSSDLVKEALNSVTDAKQALVAICMETELGGRIGQEPLQSLSPIPVISMVDRPTTPTGFVAPSPRITGSSPPMIPQLRRTWTSPPALVRAKQPREHPTSPNARRP